MHAAGDGLTPGQAAFEAAPSEPLRAREIAGKVLANASPIRDQVFAHRALGVAARTQMLYGESFEHFGRAIQLADDAGLRDDAFLTRVSRAASFGLTGRFDQALADVDVAMKGLTGQSRAVARDQHGLILAMMGLFDEALRAKTGAIRVFHRAGNDLSEARSVSDRAYINLLIGSVDAGERDALAARALYQRLGHLAGVAYSDQHLAALAGMRGDIPAALERFELVRAEYRRLGIPSEQGADAHVAILLAARLAEDARVVGSAAVAELRATGGERACPDLLLGVARADLLLGDNDSARGAADEAAAWFRQLGADVWVSLANLVSLMARFRSGERTAALQSEAEAIGLSLGQWAWRAASLEAYLIAGQVARDLGDREGALALLAVSATARHGHALSSRLSGWLAFALVEMLEGRPKAAERALAQGLRLVEEFRDALGATEMRVGASGQAEDLARIGLDLAFSGGRPSVIFKWSERFRAAALLQRPVRPPQDRQLSRTLARLRSTAARLVDTSVEGRGAMSTIEREQRRLEREVRQLTHRARGTGTASKAHPTATAVRRALHDAVFVQMVPQDGDLHAVVIRRNGVMLRRLAPLSQIRAELYGVRFALSYLTRRQGGPSTGTMLTTLEGGAGRLDQLVFGPIRGLIGDRRLVLSPPGELHWLPWSTLPTVRGRVVTVAPSAASWLRAASQVGPRQPRRVLAAGPGLDDAQPEVLEIAAMIPGSRVLTGPDATASALAKAMDGASLAHLACHGRFRSDNPSFSSLRFADGPLYVYDLERLKRAPHVVILSACDAGQAAVSAGNELRGLTAALLALGTQAIIASVVSVRDDAARALMVVLHRNLAAGAEPAAALSLAQAETTGPGADPASLAAAGSFACFGAGWSVEPGRRERPTI